jgi:ubiquitin carboxyl-terminal hydrolase 34
LTDDGKRGVVLRSVADISNIISREEVETILLYVQSWSGRGCTCCFKSDPANLSRFNWALQVLILILVEILKRVGCQQTTSTPPPPSTSSSAQPQSIDSSSSDLDQHRKRPIWDLEDKDKLIHFVGKVFLNSFPSYVGYKAIKLGGGASNLTPDDLLTQGELVALSQWCELHEPSECCPYLFRNVALFCGIGGMEALTGALKNNNLDSLLLHQVNIMVNLATNVKVWLNFTTILRLYVPFRAAVLEYMCSLVDTELKSVNARNMAGMYKEYSKSLSLFIYFCKYINFC